MSIPAVTPPEPAKAHWYAVQTKPASEDRVVQWLQRRSALDVFLPRLEAVRRWRGRKVRLVEPLFPSYLFVHMALEPAEWNTVRWTPGVKQIVGTGGVPIPVPEDAIAILQTRCTSGVLHWEPILHSGMRVRITHGPFAGLEGILERPASRADRVRVLLTLMRTVAAVEIDCLDCEVLR